MAQGLQPEVEMWLVFGTSKSFLAAHEIEACLGPEKALIFTAYNQYRCGLLIQTKCLNYFSSIIRGQTHDTAFLYLFLVFKFFDYIIITYNYDIYIYIYIWRGVTQPNTGSAQVEKRRFATPFCGYFLVRRPRLLPLYSDVRA